MGSAEVEGYRRNGRKATGSCLAGGPVEEEEVGRRAGDDGEVEIGEREGVGRKSRGVVGDDANRSSQSGLKKCYVHP
jgi:hypothetical protein